MSPLILKRGDPSRRRDNDYDVLEDGKVVGRIFHLEAAAPEGRPWMWASGHGGQIERAAHGYEATREAAMAASALSLFYFPRHLRRYSRWYAFSAASCSGVMPARRLR